jgi:hypothetical protein
MVAGSFFGDSGTLIGTATGSVIYSVAAEGFEYVAVKTHHATKGLRKDHPLQAGKNLAEKTVDEHGKEIYRSKTRKLKRPWMLAGSGLAIAGVSCAGAIAVMSATEAATGKTFHGAVTDTRDYGSTLASHSTTPPAPAPSFTPASTPSPSPTQTTVPTVTPTLVPTVVPSPTVTLIPVTPSSDPPSAAPSSP